MRTTSNGHLLTGAIASLLAVLVSWSPSAEAADATRDASILRGLDITFGTAGDVTDAPADPSRRAAWLRAFVRSRIAQDSFFDHVLPKMFGAFGGKHQDIFNGGRVLKSFRDGERVIYYMTAAKPCAPSGAVKVRPWWDSARSVWVCGDSYRAEQKSAVIDGQVSFCEASEVIPPQCGCGEHLLNCTRDEAQRAQLFAAIDSEPIRTVQHVVAARRPFSEILTTNETVRSDLGDFFYARNRFFLTGSLDLPAVLDERPRLRSRDAAFGGGVLTTPAYLFFDDSQRLVIASIWEDFLCAPLTSMAARAKEMFQPAIAGVRVRYHPSMELAAMNGCRDCHARLDHAMEAFTAFTAHNFGLRYVPSLAYAKPIKFFVRDANDVRGEGPATVAWLGRTIAAQPEFDACLVKKVEEIVYGGYPVPTPIHAHLRARFGQQRDFAALVEDTVVGRYVGTEGLE